MMTKEEMKRKAKTTKRADEREDELKMTEEMQHQNHKKKDTRQEGRGEEFKRSSLSFFSFLTRLLR